MTVRRTKKRQMLDLDTLAMAAECLKTVAHPHRLRMIQMMLESEYTVGELAEACGIASPMASEHLRLMQRSGFLNAEKKGRFVYYRVVEPQLESLMDCIEGRFGTT